MLVVCRHCTRHFREQDPRCPFCNESRTVDASRLLPDPRLSRAAQVLFTLLTAGCHTTAAQAPDTANASNQVPAAATDSNTPDPEPNASRTTPTASPTPGPNDASAQPRNDADAASGADDADEAHEQRAVIAMYGASTISVSTLVAFGSHSAHLTEEAHATVDALVELLERHDGVRLQLLGFAEPKAEARRADALSAARASAVRQALIDKGIASDRLEALRCGIARPIGEGSTRARVEFVLRGEFGGRHLDPVGLPTGCSVVPEP